MESSPVSLVTGEESASRIDVEVESLQRSTLWLALPGLFLSVVILAAVGSQHMEAVWALVTAMFFLVLIPIIWLISQHNVGLAAGALALGSLIGVLFIVSWGGVADALPLLFIPIGLVTVSFGALPGALVSAVLTIFLIIAPGPFSSAEPSLRLVTGFSIWAGVGLIWLTLRPLITAVDWSWRAYWQSADLLTQAREFQVRLQQALEDLTEANSQLNRLNTLANNLRHAAEEERRIKEQFVANVSHELRTPLNMVIGFCEMILKSPETYAAAGGHKLPSSLLADLQVVLRNSQHLSSLIDDVLDLSQIEAGQMALVKEWIDVSGVVEAAVTAVRPLFESKRLYLTADVEPGVPPVFCDRTRIREVLLNLLSNAGRFTSEGGVTLRVRGETDGVLFSVQDTGPGISPEDREKLFQPFQQLDPSIRRKHGGTGLGLSISKSFVELHDGKMWVESARGDGTTFFFRLPVDPPATAPAGFTRWINPYINYQKKSRRPFHPDFDRRPRALVVEHGAILQRLFTRYLPDMEIVQTASLDQAKEMLEKVPAQMVVYNQLPGEGRMDFLMTDLPVDTPVVMCSVADPIYYAPAPGVPEILVKPISQEALLGALDKVAVDGAVKSILLVEDEPDAQKLFVRMLTSAGRGYQVARASNGAQALRMLARQSFDVILLDLVMPEMDGYQFLRLRGEDRRLQAIPVILISAQDTRGHPIVSSFVAATRPGGISIQQLLDSVQALSAILSPGGENRKPAAADID
jgi:signal transduction histidine kinase/CheY-like chemotaxis protein